MKQTAVEWLLGTLEQNDIIDLDSVDSNKYYDILEQAKEMEKGQIIHAHGIKMKGVNNHKCVTGEQYYKETYGE
jgi:hypothetical protein